MTEHKANKGSFRHRSDTTDMGSYRREVLAYRDQQTGTKHTLAGLLARQLRNLERDPDNAALRELTMQTVRRLSAA